MQSRESRHLSIEKSADDHFAPHGIEPWRLRIFLQNAEPTHIEDSEASFPLGWNGRIKPGDRLLAFGLIPGQNYVGFMAVERAIAVRNPPSLSPENQAVKAHGEPKGSAKVPTRRHGFMSTDGSRPWLMFHRGG